MYSINDGLKEVNTGSTTADTFHITMLNNDLKTISNDFLNQFETSLMNLQGSKWIFEKFTKLCIQISHQKNPMLKAGNFIELPKDIVNSQSCINIKNTVKN